MEEKQEVEKASKRRRKVKVVQMNEQSRKS